MTHYRIGYDSLPHRTASYLHINFNFIGCRGQKTSWIEDRQLGITSAVKQSAYLYVWWYYSRFRKFCSLPQVLFGEKVLCHSCSHSFRWQMFCCSWTTYLEQLTCQSARQGSQLHRIQKTTENILVQTDCGTSDCFDCCPLSCSYLLTYIGPHRTHNGPYSAIVTPPTAKSWLSVVRCVCENRVYTL